jgi:hypothetical protein
MRASNSLSWYTNPGTIPQPNRYNLTLNLTGTTTPIATHVFSFFAPLPSSRPIVDFIVAPNELNTMSATIPTTVTSFYIANLGQGADLSIDNISNTSSFAIRLCSAVDTAAVGITSSTSYIYSVGAGSVVNNVFYSTSRTVSLATTPIV